MDKQVIYIYKKNKMVYANKKCEEITGYKRDEIYSPGFDFRTLITPESRRTVESALAKHMQGEEVEPYEFSMVTKDGKTIEVINAPKIIMFEGESAILGVLTDITERKQAEEALKAERDKLQALMEGIDHAKIGIDIIRADYKILFQSKNLKEKYGEIGEKCCYEYYRGLGKPCDSCPALKSINSNTVEMTELSGADGRYYELFTAPLPDTDGKIDKAIEIVLDITDRKQAVVALQKERDFSNTLIQSSPAFFVAIDRDGKIIMMNDSMLEALGYTLDEVKGKDYLSTFVSHSDHEELQEVFKTLSKCFEPTLNENTILARDGRELLTEWHGRSLYNDNGELDFFFGVGFDITERKEAENKLCKAFSEIEDLKEQLQAENIYLRKEIKVEHSYGEIVGNSNAIKRVLSSVEQVAGTDSTVLIMGETGTGKELLARAIHNLSSRKRRAMIKVNCAALPQNLIEGELFGREKGAYTGALTQQIGRFEIANSATIFLDEIGELSLELQAKLLRVLQDGEFERLGSSKTTKVDVRVIAATNRDLNEAVKNGSFREDLFYRLKVFPVVVPPLRERQEDIPLLVWSFVKEFETKMGKRIETISQKIMDTLQRYPWPGNVRELRNVIEHAMIITKGSNLQIELPTITSSKVQQNMTIEEIERNHIIQTLDMVGWQVRGENGAAEILGLKPNTLDARIAKLGITRKKQ